MILKQYNLDIKMYNQILLLNRPVSTVNTHPLPQQTKVLYIIHNQNWYGISIWKLAVIGNGAISLGLRSIVETIKAFDVAG